MSEEFSAVPEYSQEDLDRIFQAALATVENLDKKLSTLAEDTGYVMNAITITKPGLDMLYSKAKDDPTAYLIVASGIDFLKGLTNEFTTLAGVTDGLTARFGPLMNSTGTFSSSTDTVQFYLIPIMNRNRCLQHQLENLERIIQRSSRG